MTLTGVVHWASLTIWLRAGEAGELEGQESGQEPSGAKWCHPPYVLNQFETSWNHSSNKGGNHRVIWIILIIPRDINCTKIIKNPWPFGIFLHPGSYPFSQSIDSEDITQVPAMSVFGRRREFWWHFFDIQWQVMDNLKQIKRLYSGY